MRKTTTLLLLLVSLNMLAADISDFFISGPDSLFAVIDRGTRMDMVDYYHSGRKIEIDNRLNGSSAIDTLSDSYIKIKLSESAILEMQLKIAGSADTVVVVSKTLNEPAPDSELMFFDRFWRPLEAEKFISVPRIEDFVYGVSGKEKEELLSLVEYPLISISFDNGKLVAGQSFENCMIKENYEQLKPFLKDKISYRWTGKKFKREE